jgi:NAD(P)-dependent dehydrogenase (short-subunit alcohol dehydrogenase family)
MAGFIIANTVLKQKPKKESFMNLNLNGKVALITGGSAGIGLAVAYGLASEGVDVVICARDEEQTMAEAEKISDKFGVRGLGIRADVSKPADIMNLVSTVQTEFGGLDILINNAGTGSEETILDAPDERWYYYWDLHVMAAVRLSRQLAPLMKKRGGGVILNNASICATQPLDYEPIYNTTKAALVMFSKCLANELIPFNIRVNTINPGLVLTKDWIKTAKILTADQEINHEEYLDKIAKDNAPIGRFAPPEEIAHFFVFLCSDLASYSVGSTYYIDGGWLKVIS